MKEGKFTGLLYGISINGYLVYRRETDILDLVKNEDKIVIDYLLKGLKDNSRDFVIISNSNLAHYKFKEIKNNPFHIRNLSLANKRFKKYFDKKNEITTQQSDQNL